MSEKLLQTKLFIPPLRPNRVPRPLLIERLNQGLQRGHKLILVSAPAGFGKTTLVSEWVGHLRSGITNDDQLINDVAWLSLNTVKVHSRNIYAKLGVHSRTQAAARQLCILPIVWSRENSSDCRSERKRSSSPRNLLRKASSPLSLLPPAYFLINQSINNPANNTTWV